MSFLINKNTRIVLCEDRHAGPRIDFELFNSAITKLGHDSLPVTSCSDADSTNAIIIAGYRTCTLAGRLFQGTGQQCTEAYPGPEGYLLDVTPDRVLVCGHDSSGTFYAVQTLIQLLSSTSDSSLIVQPATVVDYPDMPLRSAFYGFYLNAMEDDSLIERATRDFASIAPCKFNMIDLASHHYGHLDMVVPGHAEEQLHERFARLHQKAREYNMLPRVGGWARWINTDSEWGSDLTTMECIRTSSIVKMRGGEEHVLRISTGQVAPNVMHDFNTGAEWEEEPVVVTDMSGNEIYAAGRDYQVTFGEIKSRDYRDYYETTQTNLGVIFSELHYDEGEPEGYPLRWAETFNPPTTIRRLGGGRIEDGQEVRVTFSYIGPDTWSLIKVRYCRSDPRVHADGPQNYIWRWCVDPIRYFGATDFALDLDETRVFAWDKRCLESGKPRSRIWADDVRYYYDTIRSENPDAHIFLWSDMVDPYHNATDYKTEETAAILSEYGMSDIIMIPWKGDLAEKSVKYFAEKNFPVMASCQHVNDEGISLAPQWAYFLRKEFAGKGLAYGIMHCRWGYGFDKPVTWERMNMVSEHAWSVAPYIIHTPVRSARTGKPIMISVIIEGDDFVFDGEDVRRGPLAVRSVDLFFRTDKDTTFQKLTMTGIEQNRFRIEMPAVEKSGAIEYYLRVRDDFNTSYSPHLAEKLPYRIEIIVPR